jgi:hypothetical protein
MERHFGRSKGKGQKAKVKGQRLKDKREKFKVKSKENREAIWECGSIAFYISALG